MIDQLKPVAALFIAVSLTACAPEASSNDTSAQHGKSLYLAKCAVCHGDSGEGAGVASLGLGAPPPGLTELQKRNGGVFPRDYVMDVIQGHDREDTPTAAMPEFWLEDLGEVVMVQDGDSATARPSGLVAIAAYLETIQR